MQPVEASSQFAVQGHAPRWRRWIPPLVVFALVSGSMSLVLFPSPASAAESAELNEGYWSGTLTFNVDASYSYADSYGTTTGSGSGTTTFELINAPGFADGSFWGDEPEYGSPGSGRLLSQQYHESISYTNHEYPDASCSDTVNIGPANGGWALVGWYPEGGDYKEAIFGGSGAEDSAESEVSYGNPDCYAFGQRDWLYGPLTACRADWFNDNWHFVGVGPQWVTEEVDGVAVRHLVQRGTATLDGGCPGVDEGTVTADIDVVFSEEPLSPCNENMHTNWDSFDATYPPMIIEFRFEVETVWCQGPSGEIFVESVQPQATTIQSVWEDILAREVRAFFTFHDTWRQSEFEVVGSKVTASGSLKSCFGIPLVSKIRWLSKSPDVLRFVASVLRKSDHRLVEPVAGFLRKAADAAERWGRTGSRIAKLAAIAAMRAAIKALHILPQRAHLKVLHAILATIADWQGSNPLARDILAGLTDDGAQALLTRIDPVARLFSDELVCFTTWKPQIEQTLEAGRPGEFIDRSWDLPLWSVQRTPVQP